MNGLYQMNERDGVVSGTRSKGPKNPLGLNQGGEHTKIGIHAANNLIGNPSSIAGLIAKNGGDIKFSSEKLKALSPSFSDVEYRVLEGVLSAFSATNYKGNAAPVNLREMVDNGSISEDECKFVDFATRLPRLVLKKEDIYRLANAKSNSVAQRERAWEGLKKICSTNVLICYERAVFDETGNIVRDSKGNFKKELMLYEDSLFKLGENLEDGTLEIVPSMLFIDQIEKYFILLRKNWREEIKQLTGKSRLPKGLERFILAISTQQEIRRRKGASRQIVWTGEYVCEMLGIPSSYMSSKPKYLRERILEILQIAAQASYISGFEIQDGFKVAVVLNGENQPQIEVQQPRADSKHQDVAEQLFKSYYGILSNKGVRSQLPSGHSRGSSIGVFRKLLEEGYSQTDISKVMQWALSHHFWSSKAVTPSGFCRNFAAMKLEMQNSAVKPKSHEEAKAHSKALCEAILEAIPASALNEKGVTFKIWPTSLEVYLKKEKRVINLDFDDKFEKAIDKLLVDLGLLANI